MRSTRELVRLSSVLTAFTCDLGNRTAHHVMGLLCDVLHNATNLQNVNIYNESPGIPLHIDDGDLRALSFCIKNIKSLQSIHFVYDSQIKVSSLAVVSFLKAMQTNTSVREFALTKCKLKISFNVTLSPDTFSLSNYLKIIDLTGCDLRGAESHLLRGLSSNTSVVELILEEYAFDLTRENGQAPTYMLENNQSLRAINLQQSNQSRSVLETSQDQVQSYIDFRCICCGLIANTSIAYLNLTRCGISVTKDNRPALFHMLQKNTSLKSLLLQGNQITAMGVSCISQGMMCNTGLEILSLQYHVNTTDVAKFIKVNNHLMSLTLSGSSLGDEFVHVVESLHANSTLRHLRAKDCNISSSCLQPLVSLQSPLESLDLSENTIGDEGAEYIAQFLANSHCIHQLKLAVCGIGDRGLHCLASALELNTSLEILNLSHNRFTDTGLAASRAHSKKEQIPQNYHDMESKQGFCTVFV